MLYAIVTEDVEHSLPLRLANRAAHLDRLNELDSVGRLFVAGPLPAIDSNDPGEAGFTGSLIVAEFDSLGAAQAWADSDPYALNGVTKHHSVKPFKKVLPAE
ncbi:MAG: YciI family protein [Pseudomonadales bacterium]